MKHMKKWIFVIVLALVALTAFLLFVLVLRPHVLVEEPTEAATVDKDGIEGELYGVLTLYDQVERKQMQEITVHNEKGTYSFTRQMFADPSSAFVLTIDGKDFSHIEFNEEKFSDINKTLAELGEKYGLTPAGMAIAWLLRLPEKTQPIVGTTKPERVKAVAEAADVTISREDWYRIYREQGYPLP